MTIFMFVVAIAGASIDDFARNIKGPEGYQSKLAERKQELLGWLAVHKIQISENVSDDHFNLQRLMRFFTGMLASLGGVLSNAFLVLLTLIFILLEAAGFPKKLLALSKGDVSGLERVNKISRINSPLRVNQNLAQPGDRVLDRALAQVSWRGLSASVGIAGIPFQLCAQHWFDYRSRPGSHVGNNSSRSDRSTLCGLRLSGCEWNRRKCDRTTGDGPRYGTVDFGGVRLSGFLGLGARTDRHGALCAANDDREDLSRRL